MITYGNYKRREIIGNVGDADLDVASPVKAIHLVQQLGQNPLEFTVGAGLCVKSISGWRRFRR